MKLMPVRARIADFPGSSVFRAVAACGMGMMLAGCVSPDAGKYLGKDPYLVYPPNLLVDQTTMPFPSGRPGVDWGLSLVWLGDHYLLSADLNTTPRQPTQVWRIVAVQNLPLLKSHQMIALGTCRDAGKPMPWVTAVVNYDPSKPWFDDVQSAWIYDFHKVAFTDYPTATLACLNPRYGLGLDKPPASGTGAAPTAATRSAPPTTTRP